MLFNTMLAKCIIDMEITQFIKPGSDILIENKCCLESK